MGASTLPRPPFDWPHALKDAGAVAAIVVLLTIALLGFRIQDASGGPPLAYRFDDVVAAALVAFLGRLGIAALRAQRAVPVLAGALVFAIALTAALVFGAEEQRLVLGSTVLNATIALAAWALAARAAWLVWHAASETSAAMREARMDQLSAQVQRWAGWVGPLLLGLAVSSSRSASQARPMGSLRMRSVNRLVTRASATAR